MSRTDSEPNDHVECHSGHSYAQRPTAFVYQNQRREVKEVLANWRTPEGILFRVLAHTGEAFELYYNPETDNWQIRPV